MKYALLMIALVASVFYFGEDRYRYPCQNPRNWDLKECKPPICTIEGTCPDKLLPPEMLIVKEEEAK